MGKAQNATLVEKQWRDVRRSLKKVSPQLTTIIDELDVNDNYTLFVATYPFGSEILQEGKLCVPNQQGKIVSLNDGSISADIQQKLGYNLGSNPVSVILKKSLEVFMIFENYTVPMYGLLPSGEIFGTARVLSPGFSQQPAFLWNMTAGSRALFMLPKISKQSSHHRLVKQFNLKTLPPKNLVDHWDTFKAIMHHESCVDIWQVEVIYFPAIWFEQLDDEAWIKFKSYLLQAARKSSEYWRHQFVWELIFSIIKKRKNIKPDPHIEDTVKHLIAMSTGSVCGFIPAVDDVAAPISELQRIYLDVYRLENYAPIIMHPGFFSLYHESAPIYYSLQYASSLKFSPKNSQRQTVINDLYQTASLLNKYIQEIKEGELNIDQTPLDDVSDKAIFDFFHSDETQYPNIYSSKNIPEEDCRFLNGFSEKNNQFPHRSSFVRGCVRIKQS
ncbi:MAG: hypothetical protein JKY13_03380 [Gammaproteobacteria bacterium]|nr:hypothetical protein [Gammaproteobacteria bacterium]